MKIKNVSGLYVFAGNPVVVESTFNGADFDPKGGRVSVTIDGEEVYAGRFFPPLKADISEILDSSIRYFPEARASDEIIKTIFDAGNISLYGVTVEATYSGEDDSIDFVAFPGGVSNQNFKAWAQWGTDALSARFLNSEGNFFLTTRSGSWTVAMKETEINPLYFVRPARESTETFQVFNSVTGEKLHEGEVGGGCYALDIEALRRTRFLAKKDLVNVFDVHVDGRMACRIVVEKADTAEHRHRIKFRNSLGVFEVMETTGELVLTPEYEDNKTFKQLDPVTRVLYNNRERAERSLIATLNTGVKHRDDLPFLMDMISSDEVYLLDLCETPVKVIPTAKKLEIPTDATEPLEAELSLQFVNSESNILEDVFTGKEARRPKVFTDQFDNKFN